MNKSFLIIKFLMFFSSLKAQNPLFLAKINPKSIKNTLKQLTTEQKIGQLFMVAAVADEQKSQPIMQKKSYRMDQAYIEMLIQNYHIGGLIFFGTSTPKQQKEITDYYQQLSQIPLLIGQDLEWGLAMRLQQMTKFPYAMTLGAIADNNLIYELGKEIGRQCRIIGVHINFAPVADINSNPANPVINHRSFGNNKNNVAQKAIVFMQGLQDAGILACAKHFPGHGDTHVDSHKDLPCILHNKERLQTIELCPFKKLIQQKVNALMIAHLLVPAFDKNNPTSLSSAVVTDILKKEFGFTGLIITDALDMQGATKNRKDGDIALQALLAGNDILLCPQNVPIAVNAIKKALANGTLTMKELDEHVHKILQVKQWISNQPCSNQDIDQLETPYTHELKKKLYREAITLVKDTNQLITQIPQISSTIPLIQIGSMQQEPFTQQLQQQQAIKVHIISHHDAENNIAQLYQKLANERIIIIGMYGMNQSIKDNYGITKTTKQLINKLNNNNKQIILVVFGNPYSIQFFKDVSAIIVAYEDEPDAQCAAADVIFGNLKPRGKLPVKVVHASSDT